MRQRRSRKVIEKIKALLIKHREIIVYLIVGGITTVISWAAKFIWNFAFYDGTAFPTVTQNFILSMVNWIAGVASAYPMNRRWVFQSKNPNILKEASGFVASRVATLGLDILVMQVLVLIGVNVYVATIISAILVIVGNYVLSKFFIFKNKA